jgi:hypothetical protein
MYAVFVANFSLIGIYWRSTSAVTLESGLISAKSAALRSRRVLICWDTRLSTAPLVLRVQSAINFFQAPLLCVHTAKVTCHQKRGGDFHVLFVEKDIFHWRICGNIRAFMMLMLLCTSALIALSASVY